MDREENATAFQRDEVAARGNGELSGSATTARKTKVPVTEQEKLLDELHMQLSELTARLETVLTPEMPTDAKLAGDSQPDMPKSPMTYRVEMNNATIRSAIRKVRNLIERTES